METIEILVYIMIAVIAGGLLVMLLKSVDHEKQYHDYVDIFRNEEQELYKVNSEGFAMELAKRWEACRFGMDNATFSVFVEDNASLDRGSVVLELLRIDKCDTIDCRNLSAGFEMRGTIETPKIINIRCFNNSLIVR